MEYFKGLNRKEYILKANEIIQRDGIDGISIRKLAKDMGCSSANLYRYFSGLEELIYYAAIGELKDYIISLQRGEKIWENIWDRYVGVWYCYCMEAFRKPKIYNLIFFNKYEITLSAAIGEYYQMFPKEINESSTSFQSMLKNPDFLSRDFEMCKLCIERDAISYEEAVNLNRIVCMMYKGYLKTILDEKISSEDEINEAVWRYIDDIEKIIGKLAKRLYGYEGYRKVLKRKN